MPLKIVTNKHTKQREVVLNSRPVKIGSRPPQPYQPSREETFWQRTLLSWRPGSRKS